MIAFAKPYRFYPLAALLLGLLFLSGCTGGKKSQTNPVADTTFTPPSVSLSSEPIHSPSGDMLARLPEGWVRVNPSDLESPQVFAMACDSAYTISVVFSESPINNATLATAEKSGLKAVAQSGFQRRYLRSNRRAKMKGEIEEFAIGLRNFAAYTYSTDTMKTKTRVAVFITGTHLYECAISQMTFRNNDLPSLATLRYIQQLILSSVEW